MANDFSSNLNCVAVWRFEDDPGFGVDSQGSNDLTNSGADEETTVIAEGAQAALFVKASNDYMLITDANQDAGFPWRYDDGAGIIKDFSICFWIYPTLGSTTQYIISKYKVTGDLRVFALFIESVGNTLQMNLGHTSGTLFEDKLFTTGFTTGRWYHVGVTYDSSDYSFRFRIWDATAETFLDDDVTGNYTQAVDERDIGLYIGSRADEANNFNGYLDEVVVFNSVLTTDEIDAIRSGTYLYSTEDNQGDVRFRDYNGMTFVDTNGLTWRPIPETYERELSDGFVLSDLIAPSLANSPVLSDGIVLSDQQVVLQKHAPVLSDSVIFSDIPDNVVNFNTVLSDSFILSDTVLARCIFSVRVSDGIVISDAIRKIFYDAISDGVIFSDGTLYKKSASEVGIELTVTPEDLTEVYHLYEKLKTISANTSLRVIKVGYDYKAKKFDLL